MKFLLGFCLFSLALPLPVFAQSAAWAPVQGVGLGERVEVTLFSRGGRIRGSVERVTDEVLVVRQKHDVVTVNRADVRRIRIDPGRKSKFAQILAPTVTGAIALNAPTPRWNRGADTAFMVGSGYLFGWGLDGMINNYRHKTIYEGQPPLKK